MRPSREHGDAVAEEQRLLDVVRDEQHRLRLVRERAAPATPAARARVIASSAPNGSSSSSTSLPASSVRRKATRWRMPPESRDGRRRLRPVQAEAGEERARLGACVGAAQPRVLEREAGVVERRPPRAAAQSRCGISAQCSRRPARRRRPPTGRSAAVGLVQPGDEREQRGLAGSAAADDPEPLVRRDVAGRLRPAPTCRRGCARRRPARSRRCVDGPAFCDCSATALPSPA